MLSACSACAGDYEDPDRTAWEDESSGEAEGESPRPAKGEEFPAES